MTMHRLFSLLLLCLYVDSGMAGTFSSVSETQRDQYIYQAKASLFLSRATFGPTMTEAVSGRGGADIFNLAQDLASEVENKVESETDLDAEKRD